MGVCRFGSHTHTIFFAIVGPGRALMNRREDQYQVSKTESPLTCFMLGSGHSLVEARLSNESRILQVGSPKAGIRLSPVWPASGLML